MAGCVAHPGVEPTRQCTQCQRLWCAACVKLLKAGTGTLEVCARCNGLVKPPWRAVAPPAAELAELLGRVVSGEAVITAAGLAAPLLVAGAVGWLPGMGWLVTLMHLIFFGTLVGYYFQIIDHVGAGRAGLPGASDLIDDGWALASMTLRGALCVLVGTLPYLVWIHFVHAASTPVSPATVLLLLLVGLAYLPAAVLAVVLTRSTFGAIYPVAWGKIIARAPGPYLRLVGLFLLALIAFGLVRLLAGVLDAVPVCGAFLVGWVASLLWFAQAALVGGFLRRHADELGFG